MKEKNNFFLYNKQKNETTKIKEFIKLIGDKYKVNFNLIDYIKNINGTYLFVIYIPYTYEVYNIKIKDGNFIYS